MSGKKLYDRTELLDRAVEVFRLSGFNGTSTETLVQKLGVNRKSMYAEFGSKQELFVATLEHYDQKYVAGILAPVEVANAGLNDIKQVFSNLASENEGAFHGLGCLMGNTATESAALDTESRLYVDAYFDRIKRAFVHALENAHRNKEAHENQDIEDFAAFLTTLFIGTVVSIRAAAPAEQLWASYRVVSDMIDALPSGSRKGAG